MIRVTKSTDYEVYHVRADHEWATIAIRGWQAKGVDDRPREIGEILIYSSFGSWAYQWCHLGEPFKPWLAGGIEMHYIAEKFLGSKAYVFNGERTVRDLRQSLLEHRRTGDITKADARAIWDFIDENESEMESSGDRFVERMHDCMSHADWPPRNGRYSDAGPERGARHFLEEPWDRICTSIDHQFAGFWRTIMPAFQQALKDELQEVAA
jgi:hypothetical protein